MQLNNTIINVLDWSPDHGRTAFHFAMRRFLLGLVENLFRDELRERSPVKVATFTGAIGVDMMVETESGVRWNFELKVSTAPGLLPPSLYADTTANIYRWSTGRRAAEHWVLVTNYELTEEMKRKIGTLGASCVGINLERPVSSIRQELLRLFSADDSQIVPR